MFGHPKLSIQTGPEAPKVVAKVNGKVKKIDKPWTFKYDLYFYRSTTSKRLMMYLILISPPPGPPPSRGRSFNVPPLAAGIREGAKWRPP